jgi:diaminopimelate decarboxylase
MKPVYEKPVLHRVETGSMNKFGASPVYARKIRTEIEGQSIESLVAAHGSPLFVFSEAVLRRRYREVHQAFATRYPNVALGWSYKTNYLPAVCAVLHQEGALAEVVSSMEYEKARALGIPGDQIIFNGPHKSLEALRLAATEGALIQIDHLDELGDLEKVALDLGRTVRAGLRVNLDAGIYPQWSRFGLNLESGQALDAVKRISVLKRIELTSLHCHLGTFILDPNAYAVQVTKLAQFAQELEKGFAVKITTLDIGGGLPSRSRLKGTYHAPELSIPSLESYAEKITDALYRALGPGQTPRLVLESGRAIVDEAGWLITTLFASKRLPDGRKAYLADAGVNLLYTSTWYRYTLELDRPTEGVNEPAIIFGPLCMNIDILDEGTLLPPLAKGSRLILSPVGAYNVTQWMQFIEYRPAVVMIGQKGEVDVIREREDLSDLARREKLPARLALSGGAPRPVESKKGGKSA